MESQAMLKQESRQPFVASIRNLPSKLQRVTAADGIPIVRWAPGTSPKFTPPKELDFESSVAYMILMQALVDLIVDEHEMYWCCTDRLARKTADRRAAIFDELRTRGGSAALGLVASAVSAKLGIGAADAYNQIRRIAKSGAIRRDGKTIHLVDGQIRDRRTKVRECLVRWWFDEEYASRASAPRGDVLPALTLQQIASGLGLDIDRLREIATHAMNARAEVLNAAA